MIYRIKKVVPLKGYCLSVLFDDGRHIIYDMHDDLGLPGYEALVQIPGLFMNPRLDQSRTCVYWNEDIDLPSDILYEYGKDCAARV